MPGQVTNTQEYLPLIDMLRIELSFLLSAVKMNHDLRSAELGRGSAPCRLLALTTTSNGVE